MRHLGSMISLFDIARGNLVDLLINNNIQGLDTNHDTT
jgi:hypothetical protein